MATLLDTIENRLVEIFREVDLAEEAGLPADERLSIQWDRADRYAIDASCRTKAAALGLVDQGQTFRRKTSLSENVLRMAVEFFVRCNKNEDIKTKVNAARRDILLVMLKRIEFDDELMDLITDIVPDVDEVFIEREKNMGEGVVVFNIVYRSHPQDIGRLP